MSPAGSHVVIESGNGRRAVTPIFPLSIRDGTYTPIACGGLSREIVIIYLMNVKWCPLPKKNADRRASVFVPQPFIRSRIMYLDVRGKG